MLFEYLFSEDIRSRNEGLWIYVRILASQYGCVPSDTALRHALCSIAAEHFPASDPKGQATIHFNTLVKVLERKVMRANELSPEDLLAGCLWIRFMFESLLSSFCIRFITKFDRALSSCLRRHQKGIATIPSKVLSIIMDTFVWMLLCRSNDGSSTPLLFSSFDFRSWVDLKSQILDKLSDTTGRYSAETEVILYMILGAFAYIAGLSYYHDREWPSAVVQNAFAHLQMIPESYKIVSLTDPEADIKSFICLTIHCVRIVIKLKEAKTFSDGVSECATLSEAAEVQAFWRRSRGFPSLKYRHAIITATKKIILLVSACVVSSTDGSGKFHPQILTYIQQL